MLYFDCFMVGAWMFAFGWFLGAVYVQNQNEKTETCVSEKPRKTRFGGQFRAGIGLGDRRPAQLNLGEGSIMKDTLPTQDRISMRSKKFSVGLKVALAILAFNLVASTWAQGQALTLLNLTSGYGWYPTGALISDSNGNLYGTTVFGGKYGYGTVYELVAQPGGGFKKKLLYSFCGLNTPAPCTDGDGATPVAGLTLYNGNLYGTTEFGGQNECVLHGVTVGCGTVFELSPGATPTAAWKETVLASLPNASQGYPTGSVVFDSSGNLYGTASGGGSYGPDFQGGSCGEEGSVFELSPPTTAGTLTVLAGDMGCPYAGLTYNGGNLYGTASGAGPWGGVFEFTPMAGGGWNGPVWIYSFAYLSATNPNDGNWPYGGVIFDSQGNLYGTTLGGGNGVINSPTSCGSNPNNGCGTVYELSPPTSPGAEWSETILYNFGANAGDGWSPYSNLIFDANGNLYGTTVAGGSIQYDPADGGGTVFELSPPFTMPTVSPTMYAFCAYFAQCVKSSDKYGDMPVAGLIADANGNLYGTTIAGGSGTCDGDYPGCGIVFELTVSFSAPSTTFKLQLDGTTSAAETLTLVNPLGAAVTGLTPSITGPNAADFSITGGTCGTVLKRSSSCTYLVVFTPTLAGVETATLNVADSDGTQSTALKGTGYDALLAPLSATFGKVAVGSPGTPITLTMTNVSSTGATLTYTGITFTGAGSPPIFTVDPSSTCNTSTTAPGGSLAQGASCTVVVDFTPVAKGGPYDFYVEFTDNGNGTPNFKQTATLTGSGGT